VKKSNYGSSLYYASDKNVFDALNMHKVDNATVAKLFKTRNILVSAKDKREDLAEYFSRLTHDYFDHQEIASRLGIAARRERITSMDLIGNINHEQLTTSINVLKNALEEVGNIVRLTTKGATTYIEIEYTTIDYGRSDFSQVQRKDGTIEIVETSDGLVLRNTKNEYVDDAREALVNNLSKELEEKLIRREISMYDIPDFKLRSKFFFSVANKTLGYSLYDVTSVYVYKDAPQSQSDDSGGDFDNHVERVLLRGRGVTHSELLGKLNTDEYYVVRISWRCQATSGAGHHYDIEALFADPKDCTGFSFLLAGVHELDPETGRVSDKRRTPTKSEIDEVSRAVENAAADVLKEIQAEFALLTGGAK